MALTRNSVAEMITKYLNGEVTRETLVQWAENAMMNDEFEDASHDLLRDIVSRLGLADVREFGLTWEDCHEYLRLLGYNVKVELMKA